MLATDDFTGSVPKRLAAEEGFKTPDKQDFSVASNGRFQYSFYMQLWKKFKRLSFLQKLAVVSAFCTISGVSIYQLVDRFHDPSPPPREDEWIVDNIGIVLKKLPAGSFMMGSPPTESGREADEGPQTQVRLNYDFWIGKYEVTQGEIVQVMDDPSVINGDRRSWNLPNYGREPRRPVDNITWDSASAFCRNLTQKEQRLPANYEYRLPTEAEWEYACRAGTATRFSFGSDDRLLTDYAWFQKNSDARTLAVGGKLPNKWGLYDMLGNVMEWCSDQYHTNLPGGVITNPVGALQGTKRVLRGGSWASGEPAFFRSADRFGLESNSNGWAYGFRVVLAPSIKSLQPSK